MAADLLHRPPAGRQWAQQLNGCTFAVTPISPLDSEETSKKARAINKVIG